MKKLITLAIAILIIAIPAMAQELPEGLTGLPGGAYAYDAVFLVHTFDAMTSDKAARYDSNDKRTASLLTKESKDLSDRLLKIDDVARVIITYRQVLIYKFPLVPDFDGMKGDIVGAFEAVFD